MARKADDRFLTERPPSGVVTIVPFRLTEQMEVPPLFVSVIFSFAMTDGYHHVWGSVDMNNDLSDNQDVPLIYS